MEKSRGARRGVLFSSQVLIGGRSTSVLPQATTAELVRLQPGASLSGSAVLTVVLAPAWGLKSDALPSTTLRLRRIGCGVNSGLEGALDRLRFLVVLVSSLTGPLRREKMVLMDPVQRGILATLVYFDLQDYPLTAGEIWRWWYGEPWHVPSRDQVREVLEGLVAARRLVRTNDYYHLPNRNQLVGLRHERRQLNVAKWQRANRATRFLQSVPFFRYLAVCNTVAISNGRRESDIDVFIVAKDGRLWLTRLIVTAIVAVLGLRRHGSQVADRICLSFYATDAGLDFHPLLLSPSDPYFAFWIDQLVPLYDAENIRSAIRQRNPWVRQYLPNAWSRPVDPATVQPLARAVQRFGELLLDGRVGNWLELLARKLQRSKMAALAHASPNRRVVISDQVLKFHEEDRRAFYNSRFRARLNQLLESFS